MRAKTRFTTEQWHDVKASLKDGPQNYVAVTNNQGQLLAWGLQGKAEKNEWLWVKGCFR